MSRQLPISRARLRAGASEICPYSGGESSAKPIGAASRGAATTHLTWPRASAIVILAGKREANVNAAGVTGSQGSPEAIVVTVACGARSPPSALDEARVHDCRHGVA